MSEQNEESTGPNWRERLQILAIGFFAGTLITVLILTANRRMMPTPIVIEPAPPLPTATAPPPPTQTATPGPLSVYVSGAVETAGVYELPTGARLGDAIESAGGFTTDAAEIGVNLAQPLRDGDQVHIPTEQELSTAPPIVQNAVPVQATSIVSSSGSININEATAAELETLPGIGPSTAAQIIAYREANGPFATIEAIMEVPGIGPAKFAGIEEIIVVGE